MKKKSLISIFLLFLLFFLSNCSSDKSVKELENKINSHYQKNDLNSEFILAVPNSGCPSCISTAELFLRDRINNEKLFVILTKISSPKSFEIRTDINIDSTSNVILDKENRFSINGPNQIYPCLFVKKQNKMKLYGFQKPDNNIFSFLDNKLD